MRIFSYLPNPRVWKSLIAAKIAGFDIEVLGDKPQNLVNWLWDYNARELKEDEKVSSNPNRRIGKRGFSGNLYKTDNFLKRHPFGTVPAAFLGGGKEGVFESNSILRAVARESKHKTLYGRNSMEASRIDSFLDANLVFSREHQVYILEIEDVSKENYFRMKAAYEFYLEGLSNSLERNNFICGDYLSIADISFACDFAQFLREAHYEDSLKEKGFEVISKDLKYEYPFVLNHLIQLCKKEEFRSVMGTYLDWYKHYEAD
tara:strand:+ start:3269 stop:4048 length:780 start_codon:yes stop_codon:yes gene_type:complete